MLKIKALLAVYKKNLCLYWCCYFSYWSLLLAFHTYHHQRGCACQHEFVYSVHYVFE